MAVNAHSPQPVIEFYGDAFPALYWQIQANEMHSRLVQEIARRHPAVALLDTHPGLDGEHDKFIDPMHFAPEGDRQMAETMFEGIRGILAGLLVDPNPHGEPEATKAQAPASAPPHGETGSR
jgi:hypothetical protein